MSEFQLVTRGVNYPLFNIIKIRIMIGNTKLQSKIMGLTINELHNVLTINGINLLSNVLTTNQLAVIKHYVK
jgi:hypothetical protein